MRRRSASHLRDTKKLLNKNFPVLNETRSIFYKENCAANRFCVIIHKGKARRRSASHLRDTKKL